MLVSLLLLVEGHLVLVHVAAGGEAPHGRLLSGLTLLLLLEEAGQVVRQLLAPGEHPIHGAGTQQAQRGPGLRQKEQGLLQIINTNTKY